MEIQPLAITKVEWSIFIDACQRVLGYSPTRGVDNTHLDINDPAAFLALVDMENRPLEALRNEWGAHHGHFMISFIYIGEGRKLGCLRPTSIKIIEKRGSDEDIAILTGSMDEWYRAIRIGCRRDANRNLRQLTNLILARLEQAGFREIFSDFEKRSLQDGTFELWISRR